MDDASTSFQCVAEVVDAAAAVPGGMMAGWQR